jgi:hypothetical protein
LKILLSLVASAIFAFGCQNSFVAGQAGSQETKMMGEIFSPTDLQLCTRPSQSSAMSLYSILNEDGVIGGILQEDILNYALEYDGKERVSRFEVLFPVESKNIYLITAKNSNITDVAQLNTKSIAVGRELSDSSLSFLFLSKKLNYDWTYMHDDFDVGIHKLFGGEVDGVFFLSDEISPELKKDFEKVNVIALSAPYTLYRDILVKKSDYLTEVESEKNKKIQDSKTYNVQLLSVVDTTKLTKQNSVLIQSRLVDYISKQIQSSRESTKSLLPSQAVDEATQKAKDLGKKFFSSLSSMAGLDKPKETEPKQVALEETFKQFTKEEQQIYDRFCNFQKNIRLTHSFKMSQITQDACNEVKNRFLTNK